MGTIAIDAAGISANDLTFNTAGYTFAGTGGLAPNGTTNVITQTAAATITANLAGTTGFIQTGAQTLTLSGNNSGLSGTMTISDVAATNTNGVIVTSLVAIGGLTAINVGVTGTTGGFFRLQGSGNAVVSGLVTQAANIPPRLDKMGSGTWKFTNAGNTFSGGVRVLEGTLEVTGMGNGGAAAAVLGTASSAAGNICLNGGTLK